MISLPAFADVAINSTNFPDSVFRSYISSNFDTNNDGSLSDSEIAAVTAIDVSSQGITRMNGIEHFTALEDLNFRSNNVSNIDLSKNVNLISVDCVNNYLVRLDVSACTSLRYLDFSGYRDAQTLTTLNISNTAIPRLLFNSSTTSPGAYGYSTSIISNIYARNCTELTRIDLRNLDNIDTADFSGSTSLERVSCYDAWIKNINFSGCTALQNLKDIANIKLKSVNLSGCTSLVSLDVSGNELSALDLSTCTALEYLKCSNNNLPYLELASNTALQYLNCTNQKITAPLSTSFNFKSIMDSSKLSGIVDDSVHGFNSSGGMIATTFSSSSSLASFAYTPSEIDYEYSTGYGTLSMPVNISSSENSGQNEPPSITTSSLPTGNINSAYALALQASGLTPITWSITGGSLPTGLSFSSGGLITGTPSASGEYTFTVQAENAIGSDTKSFTLSIGDAEVNSKPIITTPAELEDGKVGYSYEVQLMASGTSPITWKISKGKLPGGLTLSSSGLISGTVSKAGKFNVTIKASNSIGDDTRAFTITSYIPPEITTSSIKNAKVGTAYNVSFKSKGTAPLAWNFDGDLPSGLTFDSSKGRITGKPTINGTYNFTLTLSNATGEISKDFSLTVNAVAPKISTNSLPNGTTGKAYKVAFKATGTSPITWSLEGNLPDGLVFDDETGIISGTPTEMCDKRTLTITASNMESQVSKTLALTIKGAAPAFKTTKLPNGYLGTEYSTQIITTGTSPITLSASGLPTGLSLNDDTISGIPTESGTFKITLTASNLMKTITKNLKLTIISPPVFNDGGIVDEGTIGVSYSYVLDVSGTKKITYAISGGSLPKGITLNAGTGALKGKPTEAGTFEFTVTAKNSSGESSMTYSMIINAEAPKITGRFTSGTVGKSYRVSLKVSGTAPITWSIDGDLPDGLTFADGMMSGTPAEAFNGYVSVTASNSGGSDTKTYRLLVKDSALRVSSSPEEEDDDEQIMLPEEMIAIPETHYDVHGLMDEEYVVVAVLPEVSFDVSGMHEFDVVLSDDARVGEKLIWLANSESPSDDDEIAEFYDESGEEIDVVPENRKVTVGAWLTEGVTYEPVIAVKRKK